MKPKYVIVLAPSTKNTGVFRHEVHKDGKLKYVSYNRTRKTPRPLKRWVEQLNKGSK